MTAAVAAADPDEEHTELVDAKFARVDMVGKAANGTAFLIAKAQAEGRGLIEADVVRDLIAKSEAQEGTVTDSAEAIIKADDEETPVNELDVSEVLAEPADSAPGVDTDPSSPAWEAVDSATAQKWTAIAVRLKNALGVLEARETVEAVNGDTDDYMNADDLCAAQSAADFIISILAPYAVGEQAEVDFAADEARQMVGKAMAGFDTAPLELVEGLAPVIKAGRAISGASEAKLQTAYDSIGEVLSTIKQTPPSDDAAPVAKSKEPPVTDSAEPKTTDEPEGVITVAPVKVAKAKGDPLTPVYDENGKLVGMVDSTDLIPIATAAAASDSGSSSDATTPVAPAADATVAPATTAAPDAATIPGTDTVQAPPVEDDTVTKAALTQVDALTEALTTVAKQFEQHTELAEVVKGLQERLDHISKMPDDRKSPRLNGSTGTAGPAIRDDSQEDQFAELKKAAADADLGLKEGRVNQVEHRNAQNALIWAQIKDRVSTH